MSSNPASNFFIGTQVAPNAEKLLDKWLANIAIEFRPFVYGAKNGKQLEYKTPVGGSGYVNVFWRNADGANEPVAIYTPMMDAGQLREVHPYNMRGVTTGFKPVEGYNVPMEFDMEKKAIVFLADVLKRLYERVVELIVELIQDNMKDSSQGIRASAANSVINNIKSNLAHEEILKSIFAPDDGKTPCLWANARAGRPSKDGTTTEPVPLLANFNNISEPGKLYTVEQLKNSSMHGVFVLGLESLFYGSNKTITGKPKITDAWICLKPRGRAAAPAAAPPAAVMNALRAIAGVIESADVECEENAGTERTSYED